jgi:outer membrane protein TolC
MSDEYREIQKLVSRMSSRRKQALEAIAQLEKTKATLREIVAEVETDIHAAELQLQAYRQSGDEENK